MHAFFVMKDEQNSSLEVITYETLVDTKPGMQREVAFGNFGLHKFLLIVLILITVIPMFSLILNRLLEVK